MIGNNIQAVRSPRKGIAMFVVLGAVVLFGLLGFVALSMSQRDSLISGDLVKIKSQRIAALSGFNLAIARMQQDPANAVTVLSSFKTTPANSWLVFDDASKSIKNQSTEPQWYSLDDAQSAVRVQILGISDAGTSGASAGAGVKILLKSYGRGKDGNIHIAQGMYVIHGVDYEVTPTTAGPSNAFQAQGGVNQFHIGANVDGGVYSGSADATMHIENPDPTGAVRKLKSIRIAGSLRLTQGLAVEGNSVIGGTLNGNGSAIATTFEGNLVVRGGLALDNPLVVKKSFYLSGCAKNSSGTCINNIINTSRKLTVNEYFKVEDQLLYVGSGSSFEVGLATKPSIAYLANGMELQGGAGAGTVYGDLHLGNGPAGSDDVGGVLKVTGNLDYFGTGSFRVSGSADIDGNAYFAGKARTSVSNTGTLNIDGNGQFMAGIASTGTSSTPSIIVGGKSYLFSPVTDRQAPTAQRVVFGDQVSLNGWVSSTFKNTTTWSFKAGATDKTWSYNSTGLIAADLPAKTAISGSDSYSDRSSDDPVPTTWVTSHTSVQMPGLLATSPSPNLGYTAGELDLSLANNPSSDVMLNAFPASKKALFNWSSIRTKYRNGTWTLPSTCTLADLGEYGKLPTAAGINCIYNHQKALGTAGILWNDAYLVIIQDGLDADAKWSSYSATGTSDPGELGVGVKVFFLITGGLSTNSIGYWYSNPSAGSIQILYSATDMDNFMWKTTLQGFLYFNLPDAKGSLDINAFGGGAKLVGSWENVNPNRQVKFQLSNGGQPMTIEYSSKAAQTIFTDIAKNFTNQETLQKNGVTQKKASSTELQPIILFSGDKSAPTGGAGATLKLFDGWIQFERLGEYR